MAREYAALKTAFPAGNPFIFGPVDSDHYFYFVYDDIHRNEGIREGDVQLNVKMYNIKNSAADVDAKHPLSVHFNDADQYQVTRGKFGAESNTVSFETNYGIAESLCKLRQTVIDAQPDRFAILVLLDPHSDEAQQYLAGQKLGFEPEFFPNYSLLNRTTNRFEHGYIVMKLSYSS